MSIEKSAITAVQKAIARVRINKGQNPLLDLADFDEAVAAIEAYEAAKASDQPVGLSQDQIMLAKQNAYLAQYKERGLEFMLAATMIYQRAWETALATKRV